MTPHEKLQLQTEIARELGVAAQFDAERERERRVGFLADYLQRSGMQSYVLGISGGVDSLAAGCLAQRAVARVRARGGQARFFAMRLPYGQQRDEADAQQGLDVIQPDETLTLDIQPATDAMHRALRQTGVGFRDEAHEDFVLGNIKARQRMIAQYAVAGAQQGLVIGTDHAAEALMGFFTKFGDGACDLTPLAGLNKRRVRAVAALMGAPEHLVQKVPTADLEGLHPLRPDEEAFGVSYEMIDDFLELKPVPGTAFDIILRHYRSSAHKRALPAAPG
ncbi:MAG: ammonia-dependent NAD(+) synthetase [Pigmentiphaga sp.]|nr:ammonia-dependent NAD(+) synthetase [Pigmentiphaga sp.]